MTPSPGGIAQQVQVEPEWLDLLENLTARPGGGRVGVMGGIGSGKSTLVAWLGNALAERAPTGRLDADVGQARIGPPATVGLGYEPKPEDRPEALCFVGSVSPAQHLLALTSGVVRLAHRAGELGLEWLVVDPTGFLDFPAGREFHYRLIEILELDHLVAVDGAAMAPVLDLLRHRHRPEIHEVPRSSRVIERSRAERREYRSRRFRAALEGSRPRVIPASIPLHGSEPARDEAWAGLLVGLLDRDGFLLRLGVARGRTPRGLGILVPPVDLTAVSSVEVGTVRLDV